MDLRRWGLGQRYHLGDAEGAAALSEIEAVHVAWSKLTELRQAAAIVAAGDDLPLSAPRTLAGVVDAWASRKRYQTPDGEAWGREYTGLVRRELGAVDVWTLAPPAGNDVLLGYFDRLVADGKGPRTVRNRFSVVMQVLDFAVEQGWLRARPRRPRMMPKPAPVFRWITEAMFRKLRAACYADARHCDLAQAPGVVDEASMRLYVLQRRTLLSWLFYTGVHLRDGETLTADWLFLDGGAYIRHNNKSARAVGDEQFPMPEPLIDDLRELETALGRPFYQGEIIGGGRWPTVRRVLPLAAQKLGFPHTVTPAILRRSFAREMFLRGHEPAEVADLMGHVDLRMLREIYVRTPRPSGAQRSRWGRPAPGPAPSTSSGMAEVLPFLPATPERRPPMRAPAAARPLWSRRSDEAK